ncbi:hypothetical protein PFISCL1PPCAC_19031, partial [Pristionchus fissidentatus]
GSLVTASRTCLRCHQPEHIPLTCEDATEWGRIREEKDGDSAASSALQLFSLTQKEYGNVMRPSKRAESEEWTDNIRWLKEQFDRELANLLEEAVPDVAHLLEYHFVQTLGDRVSLSQKQWDYGTYDLTMFWISLEEHFYATMQAIREIRANDSWQTRSITYVRDSRLMAQLSLLTGIDSNFVSYRTQLRVIEKKMRNVVEGIRDNF